MTAYGALISLENTILNIRKSYEITRFDEILKAPLKEVEPLKEILERLDSSSKSKSRKNVNALDGRMKQRLWDFEDLAESLLLHGIHTNGILSDFQVQAFRSSRDTNPHDALDYFSFFFPAIDDTPEKDIYEAAGDMSEADGNGDAISPSSRVTSSFIQAQKDMKEDYIYDVNKANNETSAISSPSTDIMLVIDVIKETVWKLEELQQDVIGSLSRGTNGGIKTLEEAVWEIHFRRLSDAVGFLIQTLNDMKEEYIHEVNNMPDEDEDEDEAAAISSPSTGTSACFGGMESEKMIGLLDEFKKAKRILLVAYEVLEPPLIMSYAIVGMAGLGKTALAKKLYEDPDIQSNYDCRVWIRVGRKYEFNRASRDTLARMHGCKRCLIVLDDVWETRVLPIFLASLVEMKDSFIRVLITARGQNVISSAQESMPPTSHLKVMRFLNEDESKDLLCHKVFGEGDICPPELDKAAAKIANNCEGLPLMILVVAKRLTNNRDPDYWNEVAEERNSVFTDSYEEISKVLYPSYDYLPQCLKMPFMYMGVFPRKHDIPISKILSTLNAEGWLFDENKHHSPKEAATDCLEELCISYNLVLFNKKSMGWFRSESMDLLKTCRLHSSWRYLCRREARNNKFFHVLNKLVDATPHSQQEEENEEEEQVIKGQRGLCLENNILFGLKEFCSSVKSHCASSTRSLLFYGPYNPYPTPIDAIGFMLLRKLDALQLRFYTFPTQILMLLQLKYLALTCNEQLPKTISDLSNLKTLIIHPHLSIIKCHAPPSFIPAHVRDMPELEHIEILGKSLNPVNPFNGRLINLSTLVGVNADISTISELSETVPFLRKLGVQIELRPNDTSAPDQILHCFDRISTLGSLYTLKLSIVNPVHALPVRPLPTSLMLPHGLTKLHLSGMGFPWEYMDAIASLPNLLVLKLRCHAFQGPKWEIREDSFSELRYLEIEDSDLVEWKPASGSFPWLNFLSLKHCYRLRELEWPARLGKIEFVDCNPLGVTCANLLHMVRRGYLSVTASDHYRA